MPDTFARTACPPDEYLSAVLAGTAPNADLPTFDSHLATCARCQQRMDVHADSAHLRAWRADAAGRPPEFPFLEASDRPGCIGRVGRFHVEREVGRGGMGVVFRAWDDALRRSVALKVLRAGRDDAAGAARFAREAQAAARVAHDHLVPVLSVEEAVDGRAVLVLPFVDGPSLRDRLRADPEFPPREAASILREVAAGLAAAHAAGLVHRDVKPANILLDRTDGRAKLTDFGLARPTEAGDTLTQDGSIAGTPEYLPPEQATDARRAGPPADVYALGVTLYECLTGVVPFRGPLLEVIDRHRTEEPVPPRRLTARVPADLETITLKCLEKDPARRYPSAVELEAELTRFLDGRPVLARPLGAAGRARRWVRRNPLPVAVVVVSLVGAVAAGAGWWRAGVKATEAEQNALAATTRATEAEQARADARQKAALAEERAALALGAITTLVGKAQTIADTAPGTLRLKKELSEAALADLRKLAASAATVPGADRTTVKAHLKLGDALHVLGQTDDALKQWDRARELTERQMAADPLSRRDFAAAHAKLGNTQYLLGNLPLARSHYQSAVAALEPLDRQEPNDPLSRHALAVVLVGRGDVARVALDGAAARADTERAVALLDDLGSRHPDDDQFRASACHARNRLGYLCLMPFHEYAAAVGHFRAGVRTAAARLARTPADPVWQRTHRLALLELCGGLQWAGDYPAAEAAAAEVIPLLEAAAAAEPDDGQTQRQLGAGLMVLARVRQGQERFDETERLLLHASELFDRVAGQATNPALVAAEIPAAWYELSLLSFRRGRYAEAAGRFERWDRERVKWAPAAGVNPVEVAITTAGMKPMIAAVRLIPDALADPAMIAAQPPQTARWLAAQRVSVLSWRGELAEARATAAELRAKSPSDPFVLFTAAVVLGRSASAATDPADRERFTRDGLDALLASIRIYPRNLDIMHLSPDLTPLRTHPSFAARLRAASQK